MNEIRSIVLDFGGVISKPQNSDFTEKVQGILGQVPSNFMEAYRKYRSDFDSGMSSGEEYWRTVLHHLGLQVSDATVEALIHEDMKSWTDINTEMVEFIASIRPQVANLSLISNMPNDFLMYLGENFHFLQYFDELVYSCEVGINKPDPRIYEFAIEKIGIPPDECLFVDDSLRNVEGARMIGMYAIHFRNFPQFQKELSKKYIIKTH